ncbi:MAG: GGDEF domain-containing protein [Ruminococcus sp.]|nr:GGDEF domain-containing protein [Ruminococcus sp.]
MKKNKIAVIVAGIDETYQSDILDGIGASAGECSLDLSVFVSFIGTMENLRHDTGEFNIFSLPDFTAFDGAILLTNTIDYEPVASQILRRIKDAGIPAVSVDNDVEGMLHIGIDNKTAMRKITEHFIKRHGFTKFNYISGPAENPESQDRLAGFLEVLEENNITIEKDRIYYGNFRAASGKAAVEFFLRYVPEMPEAIICANDVMAAAAIDRLSDEGYRVPDDIAFSGFDYTFRHHDFRVELTTVERPLKLSGQLACRMLSNHFSGIQQERSVNIGMSTRFTESCGCPDNFPASVSEMKNLNYRSYHRLDSTHRYLSVFNRLSSGLRGCSSFDEYITALKSFTTEMAPEEFYFCLCTDWASEMLTERHSARPVAEAPVPTDYTEEMLVPIAYKDGSFHNIDRIKTRDLLPDFVNDDPPGKMYYFLPLHFGERCLGYMAVRISKLSLHNAMFQTCCISINNSLENVRKLIVLEYAVQRLGKLYTQDTFSGIYNRNGFAEATEQIYRACVDQQRDIMLMFIDLDGLKQINDTYGHSVGDTAICTIADVLQEACTDGEIFCRFGGDEFIVFAADFTEEKAQELTKKITDRISAVNRSGSNPFVLSASMGYVIAVPHGDEDIFDFVTAADKKMYVEKRKKHSKYLKLSGSDQ